jgi:hypothetical protein
MKDKLQYEDLKIGMEVDIDQLHNIYDKYILVGNQKSNNGKTSGIIVAFADKECKELVDAINMCKKKYGKRPFIFMQNSQYTNGWYSL